MKVRVNQTYTFRPVLLDVADPKTTTSIKPGEQVRVINLPSAPKANTMGQCHIESLDGHFLGMVCTNSLSSKKQEQTRKERSNQQ